VISASFSETQKSDFVKREGSHYGHRTANICAKVFELFLNGIENVQQTKNCTLEIDTPMARMMLKQY
jgi:hypothetical protein